MFEYFQGIHKPLKATFQLVRRSVGPLVGPSVGPSICHKTFLQAFFFVFMSMISEEETLRNKQPFQKSF